jgi:hypothetical protein
VRSWCPAPEIWLNDAVRTAARGAVRVRKWCACGARAVRRGAGSGVRFRPASAPLESPVELEKRSSAPNGAQRAKSGALAGSGLAKPFLAPNRGTKGVRKGALVVPLSRDLAQRCGSFRSEGALRARKRRGRGAPGFPCGVSPGVKSRPPSAPFGVPGRERERKAAHLVSAPNVAPSQQLFDTEMASLSQI